LRKAQMDVVARPLGFLSLELDPIYHRLDPIFKHLNQVGDP
jgi:hypothetical protein